MIHVVQYHLLLTEQDIYQISSNQILPTLLTIATINDSTIPSNHYLKTNNYNSMPRLPNYLNAYHYIFIFLVVSIRLNNGYEGDRLTIISG